MEILLAASLITAYVAGLAALFAPCCIGVLLPTYLASIFRQKKTVIAMTAVFFAGMLAVFLPIGLGIGLVGELLSTYHNAVYAVIGAFLFALGASIVTGYHFSLPFHARPQSGLKGGTSVFMLGLFSGLSTLCCAPVLAGAMALSILPGSLLWGGVYSLVYVLGMVSPLFVISYFLDRTNVMGRISYFKKEVRYTLLKRKISITTSNLLSGLMFMLMAVVIAYAMLTNQLAMHSSAQTGVNLLAARITDFLLSLFGK